MSSPPIAAVLFNAIFGIIVDSFAELRILDAALKADIKGKCFIYRLDRFTLETKGFNLDKHVEEDHNVWNYVNLIVTLREKDKTGYNGWETYVMSEVGKKPPAFIPQSITLALQQLNEHDKAKSSKQMEQFAALMESQQDMFKQEMLKALQTVQKEITQVKDILSNDRVESLTNGPQGFIKGTSKAAPAGAAPAAAPENVLGEFLQDL